MVIARIRVHKGTGIKKLQLKCDHDVPDDALQLAKQAGGKAMQLCFGDRARCRSRSELRLTSQQSELTGQGLGANYSGCFTDVAGF